MIRNYLTIAWRNLLRNKLFSLVNISGLAIGMVACFLDLQYVRFEWSYDKFHNDSDRIYRVTIERENPVSTIRVSAAHPGVGPTMKDEFAEVEEFTRALHQSIFIGDVTTWSHIDDQGNEKTFNEDGVYCVDTMFLDIFSFPFITSTLMSSTKQNISFLSALNAVSTIKPFQPFSYFWCLRDIKP